MKWVDGRLVGRRTTVGGIVTGVGGCNLRGPLMLKTLQLLHLLSFTNYVVFVIVVVVVVVAGSLLPSRTGPLKKGEQRKIAMEKIHAWRQPTNQPSNQPTNQPTNHAAKEPAKLLAISKSLTKLQVGRIDFSPVVLCLSLSLSSSSYSPEEVNSRYGYMNVVRRLPQIICTLQGQVRKMKGIKCSSYYYYNTTIHIYNNLIDGNVIKEASIT